MNRLSKVLPDVKSPTDQLKDFVAKYARYRSFMCLGCPINCYVMDRRPEFAGLRSPKGFQVLFDDLNPISRNSNSRGRDAR
jgi:hypothetical protein